jgi:hypothetical protein
LLVSPVAPGTFGTEAAFWSRVNDLIAWRRADIGFAIEFGGVLAGEEGMVADGALGCRVRMCPRLGGNGKGFAQANDACLATRVFGQV